MIPTVRQHIAGQSTTPIAVRSSRTSLNDGAISVTPTGIFAEADDYCNHLYGIAAGGVPNYYQINRCNCWYLANKAANPSFPPGTVARTLQGSDAYTSYSQELINGIVDAYVRAAEAQQCPEYDIPANRETVIRYLTYAYRTKWTENQIRVALYNLLRGYENGIVMPAMVRPYSLNAKSQVGRSETERWLENYIDKRDQRAKTGEIDWESYARWGGIGAAVLVIAYAIGKVTGIFKTIRG